MGGLFLLVLVNKIVKIWDSNNIFHIAVSLLSCFVVRWLGFLSMNS